MIAWTAVPRFCEAAILPPGLVDIGIRPVGSEGIVVSERNQTGTIGCDPGDERLLFRTNHHGTIGRHGDACRAVSSDRARPLQLLEAWWDQPDANPLAVIASGDGHGSIRPLRNANGVQKFRREFDALLQRAGIPRQAGHKRTGVCAGASDEKTTAP